MIEHAAASFIIVLYGGVFKTQTKHHTLFGHWLNFLFLSSCLLLAGIQKMAAVLPILLCLLPAGENESLVF
jgi:hypothetical protein